jgi:hypothetical protein
VVFEMRVEARQEKRGSRRDSTGERPSESTCHLRIPRGIVIV